MKSAVNMLVVISLFLFYCCGESFMSLPEPVIPSPPVQNNKLQVIWQAPLGVTDTNIYLSNGPVITDNKIAIGAGRGVQFRAKSSGEFLFFWDDWLGSDFNHTQQPQILGQDVFINSQIKTYLIDSQSGQTIWKHRVEHGDAYSNITLGNIYHGSRDKSNLYNDFVFLTKINTNSGKRDTLLTIPKMNDYEPGLQPPAGWISPKGDSLLIFVVRSLNFGGDLDESLDAYAYNMTADSIEWSLIDFDPDGSARVGPPLVEDDLVYISGVRTLYCLNAGDGSLVWQRRFEDDAQGFSEDLFISAIIKVGHRLVISPTNSNTYCFDAYTGEELWKETDSASSPQNMVHHESIIYTVGRGDGKILLLIWKRGNIIGESIRLIVEVTLVQGFIMK